MLGYWQKDQLYCPTPAEEGVPHKVKKKQNKFIACEAAHPLHPELQS